MHPAGGGTCGAALCAAGEDRGARNGVAKLSMGMSADYEIAVMFGADQRAGWVCVVRGAEVGRKHGLVLRQAQDEAYWAWAAVQRLILSLSKDEARGRGQAAEAAASCRFLRSR